MLITRQTDYTIRVLIYLSSVPRGTTVPAREIADKTCVPRSFIPGIISILARKKIVVTEKGKGGGVRLVKEPSEISVYEIVEAVEGPIEVNICIDRPEECPFSKECKIRLLWREIQEYIDNKLKSTKISDVFYNYDVSKTKK